MRFQDIVNGIRAPASSYSPQRRKSSLAVSSGIACFSTLIRLLFHASVILGLRGYCQVTSHLSSWTSNHTRCGSRSLFTQYAKRGVSIMLVSAPSQRPEYAFARLAHGNGHTFRTVCRIRAQEIRIESERKF